MLKQYNFRIEPTDIKAVDKLGGCRSVHIRAALQMYLQGDIQTQHNSYTQDIVIILKDQVQDFKQDKDILQKRLDYCMLPWYHKILLPPKKL
jgi:hypothetical protein